MTSFAEQLAARVAETKSHQTTNNKSSSSSFVSPSKPRRTSYGGGLPGKVKVRGGGSTGGSSVGGANSASSGLSFADRIKLASSPASASSTSGGRRAAGGANIGHIDKAASATERRNSHGGNDANSTTGGGGRSLSFADKIRLKAGETLMTPRETQPEGGVAVNGAITGSIGNGSAGTNRSNKYSEVTSRYQHHNQLENNNVGVSPLEISTVVTSSSSPMAPLPQSIMHRNESHQTIDSEYSEYYETQPTIATATASISKNSLLLPKMEHEAEESSSVVHDNASVCSSLTFPNATIAPTTTKTTQSTMSFQQTTAAAPPPPYPIQMQRRCEGEGEGEGEGEKKEESLQAPKQLSPVPNIKVQHGYLKPPHLSLPLQQQQQQQQQQQPVPQQQRVLHRILTTPNKNNVSHIQQQQNQQHQKQPPQEEEAPDETPTKVIFGAWAKIESLQQRVREAEQRAKEESQRAELAQYELRVVRSQQSPHRYHDDREDEGQVGQQQQQQQQKQQDLTNTYGMVDDVSVMDEGSVVSTAMRSASHAMAKSAAIAVYNPLTKETCTISSHEESSNNSNINNIMPNNVSLNNDDYSHTTNASSQHQHQHQHQHVSNEIQQWRNRALEAEERLSKERWLEHATAATTTSSNSQSPLIVSSSSSTNNHHSKTTTMTEESDLIRLKNAEIDVLRSQIHRLERHIQEEGERSSYHHPHHGHPRHHLHHHSTPPLVFATANGCAPTSSSSEAGVPDDIHLLRNEIRNLQYQLSITKKSPTTSTGGSTGRTTGVSEEDDYLEDDLPTLSTLDGNEDEEEYDEDNVNGSSSSWAGLCCNVWRSKGSQRRASGWRKVGSQPPGMAG